MGRQFDSRFATHVGPRTLICSTAALIWGYASIHDPAPLAADVTEYMHRLPRGMPAGIMKWRNSEMAISERVLGSPALGISKPQAEKPLATGRSPSTLAHNIERSLSRHTYSPVMTVAVMSLIGPQRKQTNSVTETASSGTLH